MIPRERLSSGHSRTGHTLRSSGLHQSCGFQPGGLEQLRRSRLSTPLW